MRENMTAQTPPLSTAVAQNGRLAGKRVLITGTGGGQGAVAQELFCNHGAHVIGCDVRPGVEIDKALRSRSH